MPAQSTPVVTLTCPKCNGTLPSTARYCPGCGEPRTFVRQELEQAAKASNAPPAAAPDAGGVRRLTGNKKWWLIAAVVLAMLFAGAGSATLPAMGVLIPIVVFVFAKYL